MVAAAGITKLKIVDNCDNQTRKHLYLIAFGKNKHVFLYSINVVKKRTEQMRRRSMISSNAMHVFTEGLTVHNAHNITIKQLPLQTSSWHMICK